MQITGECIPSVPNYPVPSLDRLSGACYHVNYCHLDQYIRHPHNYPDHLHTGPTKQLIQWVVIYSHWTSASAKHKISLLTRTLWPKGPWSLLSFVILYWSNTVLESFKWSMYFVPWLLPFCFLYIFTSICFLILFD